MYQLRQPAFTLYDDLYSCIKWRWIFLLKILANRIEFYIKYTWLVYNYRQQNNNKIIPLSLYLEIYKYVMQAMHWSQDIRLYPIILKKKKKQRKTRISTNNTITNIKTTKHHKTNKDFFSKWTNYLWIRAIVINVNHHQKK